MGGYPFVCYSNDGLIYFLGRNTLTKILKRPRSLACTFGLFFGIRFIVSHIQAFSNAKRKCLNQWIQLQVDLLENISFKQRVKLALILPAFIMNLILPRAREGHHL